MDFINVKSVEVSSSDLVDGNEIKTRAENIIAGNKFVFFPKTNKFLIPKDEIEQDILKDFPRVDSIDASMNGSVLMLAILERKPDYLWCEVQDSSGCYLLDRFGFAFAPAPTYSGPTYLELQSSFGTEPVIGRSFLPKQDFILLVDFVERVKKQGLKIDHISIAEDSSKLVLGSKTAILFKPKQDLKVLGDNIELILKNTRILAEDSLDDLEYLDLRFGNKVYYKYVGDNQVQSN